MGGYKANEASLKQVLNKAMLKRWESGKIDVEFAKQQLSNLLDRPKPGLPALPADVVEEHRPGLEKAVRDAEEEAAKREKSWRDVMLALSGALPEARDFIEREALHEELREGLKSLVTQSRARATLGHELDIENKLNEPGYLDQLQSNVESWGTRRDEWENVRFLLDIQAASDWLSGNYSEQTEKVEEPAAADELFQAFDDLYSNENKKREVRKYLPGRKGRKKEGVTTKAEYLGELLVEMKLSLSLDYFVKRFDAWARARFTEKTDKENG